MRTPSNDQLKALTGALFGVAFLICCGRFVIRWRKTGKFQADDYCQLLAIICLAIFTGVIEAYLPDIAIIVEEPQKITFDILKKVATYNAVVTVIGKFILLAVQATFLALYWIVFGVSKHFRVWWFIVAAWCILVFLVSFMAGLFNCGNISDISNPIICNSKFGTKYTQNILLLVGVLNVSAELAVIFLPITMLRTLEMALVQKAGLAFVFTMGFLTVAFDLVRTITSASPSTRKNINVAFMWSALVPFAAVVAAALPTYYSLFQLGKPSTKARYYDEFDRSDETTSGFSKGGKGDFGGRSGKSETSRLGASANRESGGGLKRDELELKLIDRQERTMQV